MENKPKSINALMAYMRNEKCIDINGSVQKRKLRYIGYFHGYKGYRYFYNPSRRITYTNFNEIQAVYDFDMKLKTILYPQVMFLETALKNYTLETILSKTSSNSFNDIYVKLLNDYKDHSQNNLKKALNKRLKLRNSIYNILSYNYGKNNIVHHYYENDKSIPIWAIFEMLTLGTFGDFLSCLNKDTRLSISKLIGFKRNFDSDGRLTEIIVYTIKDLRNSIAHNNIIFDTRFRKNNINLCINRYITAETNINSIDFNSILDYIILIAFIMKTLKCNKKDILSFINQFEDACEKFRKLVPANIYNQIVYTNTRSKLRTLKEYL